ncbi:hypothetical protein [Moheibacter sediminis]|uniref:Uncharacterized protein n=1 Tax=Moheibacter sediminis TaxID=1434700 RepID=A0A1W1ZV14_9FLAO|nr:hypothetical protein [Moheibacter sediminis]SMC51898.1 hypothetical protein SAMN06296427_103237 [Moheibacter sediminis]
MNLSRVYSITLVLLTFFIWYVIYSAQFLIYDESLGNIILAFLVSIFSLIGILILFWKKRNIIKDCQWQTIMFLLICSPLTIFFVVMNYEFIFGAVLKN